VCRKVIRNFLSFFNRCKHLHYVVLSWLESTVPSCDQYGGHGHMKHLLAEKLVGKHMLVMELGSMISTKQLSPQFPLLWSDLCNLLTSVWDSATHWLTDKIKDSGITMLSEGRDHASTIMLSNHGSTCHLSICVQIIRVYGSINDTWSCVSQAVIHTLVLGLCGADGQQAGVHY
jgi:hypothetical protein